MMKSPNFLPGLIVKARHSRFWLFVLNFFMARAVPFNRSHKFRIVEIGADKIRTNAPYHKRNHNHIRGIHACAIATIGEMSAGFLLLSKLDPAKYRLIMSKLDVDYSYQAKEDITAEAKITDQQLQEEVIQPLQQKESIDIIMKTRISNSSGNEVAIAHTTWQIKRWDQVRTKV